MSLLKTLLQFFKKSNHNVNEDVHIMDVYFNHENIIHDNIQNFIIHMYNYFNYKSEIDVAKVICNYIISKYPEIVDDIIDIKTKISTCCDNSCYENDNILNLKHDKFRKVKVKRLNL